jgi:acyl carrier protein
MENAAIGSSTLTAVKIDEVSRRVIEIVARCLDREASSVHLDSHLWGELDAESLDMLDIVYSLERAFVIRLPRLNFLQRASDYFGENTILADGIITDNGLELMRMSMPEIPPEKLRPGMRMQEFRLLITVQTFVRIVTWCMEAKAALRCSACGGQPERVPDSPMELCCSRCGAPVELVSGEALLVADMARAGEKLNLFPAPAQLNAASASQK